MVEKSKTGTGASKGSGAGSKPGSSSARPKATIDLEAKDVTPEKTSSASEGNKTEALSAQDRQRTKPKIKPAKEVITGQKAPDEKADKPAAAKSQKAKPTSASEQQGGGFGQTLAYLAASVAGGIVALFGAAYGLNWAETGGPFTEMDRAQFERRLVAVEKTASKAVSSAVSPELTKEFEALREEVETAKAQLLDLNRDISVLRERADKTDKQISEQPASSSAPSPAANVEQVEAKIADLQTRFTELELSVKSKPVAPTALEQLDGQENADGQQAQLDEKLVALKDDLQKFVSSQISTKAVPDNGGIETVKQELLAETSKVRIAIDQVRDQAGRSEIDLASLKSRTELFGEDVKTLRTEASKVNAALSDLKTQLELVRTKATLVDGLASDVKPLPGRIAKLEENLSGVLERESSSQADARKTALAVALTNLKRVVERGEAFGDELDVVSKLAPSGLKFDVLKAHSQTGVTTPTKLERSFKSAARLALDADATPKDDSIVSSLIANARSVVRVRRTGEVEGDSAEAVIARMEMRVKEGNLAAALKEGEALTGLAREAADPWLSKVSARLAVNQAMRQVETELIAALGGSGLIGPESEKQ